MKYVLMEYADKSNYTASSKAREDVVAILKKLGATYIPLFRAKTSKKQVLFSMIHACLKACIYLRKADDVYIQYPYNPQIVNNVLIGILSNVCKLKKAKLWLVMHDINSFRYTADNERQEQLYKESALLSKADHIIVHNSRMRALLMDHGCRADMRELGFFDYLYEGPFAKTDFGEQLSIVVAGNLSEEKSGYLYHLPNLDVSFDLYGVNYRDDRQMADNIKYHGVFPPHQLIENLKGSFGLVWDGPSSETCEGKYGSYLKYNDPHKFSLYIAAGLPVIVWDQSALADTVKELGIGIGITSLNEIGTIKQRVSTSEYQRMVKNTIACSRILRVGGMFKKAITDISL